MAAPLVDVVTVAHRDEVYEMCVELGKRLLDVEEVPHTFSIVDNRVENRGFAKACNIGADWGDAPVILFLNPDVQVDGPFMAKAIAPIGGRVVVTGEQFGKHLHHWKRAWGCSDWVCGACFFVSREWFNELGGFDEVFVWGWEETDFIRRSQERGMRTISMSLPVRHEQGDDDGRDRTYKHHHIRRGARLFKARWD